MSLPKYSELNTLTNLINVEQELFVLQKNLFDLRIKKATNQATKCHLFTHTKRRIAQLNFKKASLLQEKS
jgi:large subunit ribosomal protein L29